MAMVVQHNMTAMNTNRQLGISTGALAKSTEKLSSGYRINRAADDAAGLAISEKMRSQIRGLDQASTNASDGISMIQTAEGALNESHSILQRMRELAVQAANGTETDEDRDNIQDEIEQLQEELDRIATDTEFNTMKLLDGSLSAGSGNLTGAGPKFGEYDGDLGAFITSNVEGVVVKTTVNATKGGESAIWDSTGKTLTINLARSVTYSQVEIDKLIEQAKQEDSGAQNSPANVTVKFASGIYAAKGDTAGIATTAGKKASTSGEVTTYTKSMTLTAGTAALLTATATATVESPKKGLQVEFTTNTATTGFQKDAALYDGTKLTICLDQNKTYTQSEINNIISNAKLTIGAPSTANLSDIVGTKVLLDGDITTSKPTAGTGYTETAVTIDVPLANSYTVRDTNNSMTVNSTVYGAKVTLAYSNLYGANPAQTESANWDAATGTLTLNLQQNREYTQAEIDAIISTSKDHTGRENSPVELVLDKGVLAANTGNVSVVGNAGVTQPVTDGVTLTNDTTEYVGANVINITSNRYGADHNVKIRLEFTADAGKEDAKLEKAAEYDMEGLGVAGAVTSPAEYTLKLQAGKEYTAQDIETLLSGAGLNVTVELSGNEKNQGTDEPNTLFVTNKNVTADIILRGGAGVGDEDAFLTQPSYGFTTSMGGITLQVGANEGQTMQFAIDDMSSAALGVNGSKVDVTTQKGATSSLANIDAAIQKVSKQRSLLGAVQNRLEHTISSLDNTAENLQAAESAIRDVDMASEMVTMSKYNILQQAGQSMLAQANQATQGVLSLLQS